MTAPRWLMLGAGVAAALLAWSLWPRAGERSGARTASGVAGAAATRAAAGGAGFAGAALRDSLVQTGAPGTTPKLDRPATAADGFLEVRVLVSGKPRAGAHVRLYLRGRTGASTAEPAWRLAGAADTAPDGTARLPARPGVYLVAARSSGLAPGRVEFQRPAGEPVTRVSVELQSGVVLSGRTVQNDTREPVPLGLVTLVYAASRRPAAPAEEQARATSDPGGRFRFEGLEPGRYRAIVQAAGYGKSVTQVDARATREVTLSLSAASFIEGQVLTADGAPAAGAEVVAAGGEEQPSAVAGETGSFALEVTPGTWVVGARKGDASGRAESPVAVAAGATARGVQVQLGAAANISGTVAAATGGEPIADAQIAVRPQGTNGDWGRAVSDGAGAFKVTGLAPGSYDVDVTAAGFVDAAWRGVTVQRGQQVPLRLDLKRTGAVAGVVRDAAGRPVAYALVRPIGGAAEARSDDSGAYRLLGVTPGAGTFTALRDGSALGTSAAAVVPEGGTAELDFSLRDEGVVTGFVRRQDGSAAPAGTEVNIVAAGGDRSALSGDPAPVAIDPSGRYVASVPAGAYSLGVQETEGMRDRVVVTVEAGKTATQDLTFTGPADER